MSTTIGRPGQCRLPVRADRTGYAPRTDRWLYSQKISAMRNTVATMHAHSDRLKGCRAAHASVLASPASRRRSKCSQQAPGVLAHLQEHENRVLNGLRARQDPFPTFTAS